MIIEIIIPGQPCAKGRPRIGSVGGRAMAFTPKKTRTREGIVASLAADAMGDKPPLEGAVSVQITAIMTIPESWSKVKKALALKGLGKPIGRPDLDNIVKLATDGMNGIVWRDDSQIVRFTAEKMYGDVAKTVVIVDTV